MSLDRKSDSEPATGHQIFCLKGQCHEMAVEFRPWITSIGLDYSKVCEPFFPFKNRSSQSYNR
jgi:hypothetical protein